ncbi:MAG: YbaN family protein [Bacteriovoracaceae bacterium]|nr:YbaN family protein [Bacteriovoracaceae bacterium]
MVSGIKRIIFLILGWLSLVLGIIGIFLPILPTTPFALLAAYFFSKSSKKLHLWLLKQKHLGPIISNWENHGVIRLRAKILATVTMVLLFSYTLIFVLVSVWIKVTVATIGISVLIFIWTRPSEISINAQ